LFFTGRRENMKKATTVFWGFILVFLSISVYSPAEGVLSDLGFEVTGDVSVFSQYVWRGILLDRDAVVQQGFYVTSPPEKFGRLKAGVWSSHDLENRDNLRSEEFDYILDYTFDLKDISVSFGHTYYDFPDTDAFSREFYTGVSFTKLFFSPSLFFYRDYGREEDGGGNGTYAVLNLAKSIVIKNTPFTLDMGGHIGYNHELFIFGTGGEAGLKLGFSVPLTKNMTISPNVNYSVSFADLSDKDDGAQKNRFFGGVTSIYKF
jgi:hypothetical protein